MTFEESMQEGKAEAYKPEAERQYRTLKAACTAARYKMGYEQREYEAFRLPNGKFTIRRIS